MKENEISVTQEQRESVRSWEPMALTPVGNLDVIQGDMGSFAETGGMANMMDMM
jgi:hypothetical protein